MADNELLIKINADAKNAVKAFDDIKAQTEDLDKQLTNVALVSGAAFAAFTAEIFFSAHAFGEAEKASVQLTNALQNQGIFTEELAAQYKSYADAVQERTGIDNDTIVKSQAIAQTYLKQTLITQQLTDAIADLGASMGGDLNTAAEKIAKTIGTDTNAFLKQGLVISDTATEAERYAAVLEFVQLKSGGLAEAFNQADGYAQALTTSFGNLQEAIGSRFAPVLAEARKILISIFDTFSKNPLLTDFAVAAIAAGAAVSGLIAFVAIAIPIFTALSAAVTAVGLSFSIAFVGIPLLIGVVVGAIVFLALNWDKAMTSMRIAATASITFIGELFKGLGNIILAAFTLDPSRLKAGLDQVVGATQKASDSVRGIREADAALELLERAQQDQSKKAAADREAARERAHQAVLRGIRGAEIELLKLQNQNASAVIIGLKTKEIEILKALDQKKSADETALLQEKLAKIKALQEQAANEEFQRQIEFGQAQYDAAVELQQRGIETTAQLSEERLAQLRATAQTEADIDRQLQEEVLSKRVQSQNQELLNKKKFGADYAKITKALNSDEVQGTKNAADELVALQQSKNATLKSIGKIAAVASITISTAESAMNIYRGFSTIPIIGPALGVAGAAAAIAFGAERIGAVTAAASGGLIEGGTAGRDSVRALLEPGELVVPKKNFNDVVGAVQNGGGADNSQMVALLESIDAKFSNPQTTVINGDVSTDDSYIDSLVRKISDAIEFRNAQIVGVTS